MSIVHCFVIINLILTQNLCYKMTEEKKFLFQFTYGLDTLRDVMAWYTLGKVMAYCSLGWLMAQFKLGQSLVHIRKGYGIFYTKEGYDNLEILNITFPRRRRTLLRCLFGLALLYGQDTIIYLIYYLYVSKEFNLDNGKKTFLLTRGPRH